MAEKNPLVEQMLEHLVNGEQQKAEELFHEYVVSKSREIYEGLIESEIAEESDEEKDEENDEEVEEDFEEIALEADPTDDLAAELGDEEDEMGDMDDMDMDDEEGDKDPEELFQDLDAIVDELQAKFDDMKGGNDDMDDADDEMKDDFDLETVREYVEKVPAGHGAEKKGAAEKADNKKSAIDNMKNDMGGTTANILSSKEDSGAKGTAGGLASNKAQQMKTGNINVPGGKAGSAFAKKEPGHGAEKKGAAEGSTDGQSLFRGRR
jgi:hypothetical protein